MNNYKKIFIGWILFAILIIGDISAQWQEVASLPNNFATIGSIGFAIDDYGYVIGGEDDDHDEVSTIYRYDSSNDSWIMLGDHLGGTQEGGAAVVYNGIAYHGFGYMNDVVSNSFFSFEPLNNNWTQLSSCPCIARAKFVMVLHDGKIYVTLGDQEGDNEFWQYDIATDEWTQKADFPDGERHDAIGFAMEDYIYVGLGHDFDGGFTLSDEFYRYNPVDDSWLQMQDFPDGGRGAGATFNHEGKGYILSGQGEDHLELSSGEMYSYDAGSDIWSQMPAHPGAGVSNAASFVLNDEVYIINGYTDSGYTNQAYKFDISTLSSTGIVLPTKAELYLNPNPTKDFFEVIITKEGLYVDKLSIYDSEGKLIFKQISDLKRINMTNFSNGIYWVKMELNNNATLTKMIIKQ